MINIVLDEKWGRENASQQNYWCLLCMPNFAFCDAKVFSPHLCVSDFLLLSLGIQERYDIVLCVYIDILSIRTKLCSKPVKPDRHTVGMVQYQRTSLDQVFMPWCINLFFLRGRTGGNETYFFSTSPGRAQKRLTVCSLFSFSFSTWPRAQCLVQAIPALEHSLVSARFSYLNSSTKDSSRKMRKFHGSVTKFSSTFFAKERMLLLQAKTVETAPRHFSKLVQVYPKETRTVSRYSSILPVFLNSFLFRSAAKITISLLFFPPLL